MELHSKVVKNWNILDLAVYTEIFNIVPTKLLVSSWINKILFKNTLFEEFWINVVNHAVLGLVGGEGVEKMAELWNGVVKDLHCGYYHGRIPRKCLRNITHEKQTNSNTRTRGSRKFEELSREFFRNIINTDFIW